MMQMQKTVSSMWIPTEDEITYYKRIGGNEAADDAYYRDMLPLMLEHINEECTQVFELNELPANVKLFLANSIAFFSNVEHGLKSEHVNSVIYTYDFSTLPKTITDLLAKYGYGRSRNGARFHVL